MPVATAAYPHQGLVLGHFAHRKPSAGVVAAAARNLGWPGTSPGPSQVAARIRAARQAVVNPVTRDLGPAAGLDAAVSACYLNYAAQDRPPAWAYGEDPLTENSGGADWAGRQPAGTEVARLESSYVTYRVIRADLPGGVRGCQVTAGWWD
jgi:hypothetical protein